MRVTVCCHKMAVLGVLVHLEAKVGALLELRGLRVAWANIVPTSIEQEGQM